MRRPPASLQVTHRGGFGIGPGALTFHKPLFSNGAFIKIAARLVLDKGPDPQSSADLWGMTMSNRSPRTVTVQRDDADREQIDEHPANATGPEDQDFENQRIIHTFAQCMWWVQQGDNLPKDAEQRNRQWKNECYQWLREAQLVHLHLRENRLMISSL